eukprot:4073330-Amphidinium_carterae.1
MLSTNAVASQKQFLLAACIAYICTPGWVFAHGSKTSLIQAGNKMMDADQIGQTLQASRKTPRAGTAGVRSTHARTCHVDLGACIMSELALMTDIGAQVVPNWDIRRTCYVLTESTQLKQ